MGRENLTRRRFLERTGRVGALGLAWSWQPFRLLPAADLLQPGEADWPRFGCDLHNTRFNAKEKTIGPANVERLKVKWTFDTPDNWIIYSTPAVVGDSVFLGAGRYVYALDSATGKQKWKFDWGAGGDWEATIAWVQTRWRGLRSSPQYYEGRIYFGTSSCAVCCVDASTGKQIWKTPLLDWERAERMSAQIYNSPNVYAGKVYISHSGGDASIFCLDAETGAIRWKFRVAQDVPAEWETGGGSPWTSGAIDEQSNILFNGTGNNKVLMPNLALYTESLVAHDLDTGELLWYYQAHPQDSFDLDFNAHPMIFDAVSPARFRGDVRPCVAAGNKAGMYCWNRRTGQLYWKAMLGERCPNCGPENNASAVAYNKIFLEWDSPVSVVPFSLTAALNAYNGDVEWMVPNTAVSSSPIAVANEVLYQGFLNGKLQALDAKNGRKLWEYALPSAFRGGFAVANGALYAGNGEGGDWNAETLPYKYSLYCFTPDSK